MNFITEFLTEFNPFSKIDDFIYSLIEALLDISLDICIITGIIGIILYIFGLEKGKKIPILSWAIYIIIRIIGGALLGV